MTETTDVTGNNRQTSHAADQEPIPARHQRRLELERHSRRLRPLECEQWVAQWSEETATAQS
jgi:hypothetical protein